jgi:hypothetical protein
MARVWRAALLASSPRAVAQAGRLRSLAPGRGCRPLIRLFWNPSVDARNVGVEGHSSYDKAILIAYKPGWTIA